MYVVICRADRVGFRKGPYVLATREVFPTLARAEAYARTVNGSRQPLVVEGRWRELRFQHAYEPSDHGVCGVCGLAPVDHSGGLR